MPHACRFSGPKPPILKNGMPKLIPELYCTEPAAEYNASHHDGCGNRRAAKNVQKETKTHKESEKRATYKTHPKFKAVSLGHGPTHCVRRTTGNGISTLDSLLDTRNISRVVAQWRMFNFRVGLIYQLGHLRCFGVRGTAARVEIRMPSFDKLPIGLLYRVCRSKVRNAEDLVCTFQRSKLLLSYGHSACCRVTSAVRAPGLQRKQTGSSTKQPVSSLASRPRCTDKPRGFWWET
jgi:hypothetical protein